ncbi:MAG: nitroreductase family protein [Sulfurospirillaceae bacterium]|nr:nitroreductase family protein [Sulfurospirillaceae bacterium]
MKKNLQIIFDYHEETKHSYSRYARSLGYMDWANQPNPYRSYNGAKNIKLPIMLDSKTPTYSEIFTDSLPNAALCINSISKFLQFSLGLAAIKTDGYNEWALRCNASSGNLHPSEAYLILPPTPDISAKTTISHYAPKDHSLEIIGELDIDIWQKLPKESFFICVSSIVYREVWKYGERAFRYCLLDAGHAMRAIQISAKILGWRYNLIGDIEDHRLSKIFGFENKDRFNENETEVPEMMLLVTPFSEKDEYIYENILKDLYPNLDTIANNIAQNYQSWPLIDLIEEATNSNMQKTKNYNIPEAKRSCKKEAKDVVLQRRSAQIMDHNNSNIAYREFYTLLQSSDDSFSLPSNVVNLVIFVHGVEDLQQGLYIYMRNQELQDELKTSLDASFLWEKIDEKLYLLKVGDFRNTARNISCSQAIASDSAFSLGMLTRFSDEILQNGAHRYKELYWECGAIGQQLYLEATSLNLSATGIGCFLDDIFHNILGLRSNNYQSLYHFTIGRGFKDDRITTKKPYS